MLKRSRIFVAGSTPIASWFGDLMRPSITAVVAGLPRSWHTAPSMTVASRGRSRSRVQRARLVDHHQRVDPDVALRMPFGILRAVVERLHLRQQLMNHAELARERETDRRPLGLQEQFLELAPDALGRQIVERDRPSRCGPSPDRCVRSNRAANCSARRTRRESSANVTGSTTRRTRSLRSCRPSKGSRYSSVSGSQPIALIVKSRRRAASSNGIDGSPSTVKPLWPRPVFDSRRGRATSMAPSL